MGSGRSPGTYRVNTFQNRNLDERKLLGSTSGVARTGEFVGHYRGTLLKAAKKFHLHFQLSGWALVAPLCFVLQVPDV